MSAPYRVGLIVPSSNTTMETELARLLQSRSQHHPDDSFSLHSSRMRMNRVTEEELRAMNSQTARAAAEIADVRPHVVVTACLVAIMAQGVGHHHCAEAEIADVLKAQDASAPVVSSAGALVDSLKALGARRIGLVTPYMEPLTELVAGYISEAGVDVGDTVSLCVPDNRAVAALDPNNLRDHWRRLDLGGCDALVISACVQMPSLAVVEAVEQDSGLPTLSAATATAWSILQALGLDPVIPHAGRLLDGHVRFSGAARR
jgi:maleate isomerase